MFEMINNVGAQANAVRAYLTTYSGVASSWSEEFKQYFAEPEINPWFNGRERGYVVTMRSDDYRNQINIAFYEHRNSDQICAIVWEQVTTNPPTIDTAVFGDVFKDKYDVSKTFEYGEAHKMADYVMGKLDNFWSRR